MSAPTPPPGGSRRGWLIAAGVGLGAAALGAGWSWRRIAPREAADAAVSLFHAQTMPDAAGAPLAFSRFAGRTTVVNFWATWCPPCVEEMPELSALHAELAPRGLEMVGIGIDSAAKIADFAARSPVGYPLAVAGMGGSELGRAFGNAAGLLPFTVVLDREGRIAQRVLGRVDVAKLRAGLLPLLGSGPAAS